MEPSSSHLLCRQINEIKKIQNSKLNFSVLQWNVLARCYTGPNHFPTVDQSFVDFNYRKDLLAQEIKSYNADVICLQEIDVRDLEFFKSLYLESEFSFSFIKKPHSKDGLCIMMRKEKFQVLDTELMVHVKEDGVQKENLVSQVVLAKHNDAYVIVASCHLKAATATNPCTDTRLRQVSQIMEVVEKMRNYCINELKAKENNVIAVIGGDFNEGPNSPPVNEFLKNQEIGFQGAFEDEPYTLFQKYGSRDYVIKFAADHVLYSKNLAMTKKIGSPMEGLVEENGLVGEKYPSDHLSLFAEFSLLESQETFKIWKSFTKYYPLSNLLSLKQLIK